MPNPEPELRCSPPQPRFRFYNGWRNYALAIADVLRGRVFAGDAIVEAERRVADWLGVSEVILTPQGRYAIYLGIREAIRPGQTVIMSPYTLYDVVNMVIAAGEFRSSPTSMRIPATCRRPALSASSTIGPAPLW